MISRGQVKLARIKLPKFSSVTAIDISKLFKSTKKLKVFLFGKASMDTALPETRTRIASQAM